MRKLNIHLNWNHAIGGTKQGLHTLAQAVQAIADKQDEIIEELNKSAQLEKGSE